MWGMLAGPSFQPDHLEDRRRVGQPDRVILLERARTRLKAAAPSGMPITKRWIPMTTVVVSCAGATPALDASTSWDAAGAPRKPAAVLGT